MGLSLVQTIFFGLTLVGLGTLTDALREDILDLKHTRPNQFSRVKWITKPKKIARKRWELKFFIINLIEICYCY